MPPKVTEPGEKIVGVCKYKSRKVTCLSKTSPLPSSNKKPMGKLPNKKDTSRNATGKKSTQKGQKVVD